jgi:hypothetical protein
MEELSYKLALTVIYFIYYLFLDSCWWSDILKCIKLFNLR